MSQTDGRVEHVVPFVHVADLARSTAFYELFGFEVRNTYEEEGERVWCWLERGQAGLMLARADEAPVAEQQAVLFYLYASDLEELHRRLMDEGAQPGPIESGAPGPDRQFRVDDPDDYCLMVTDAAAVVPPNPR